MTAFYDDCQVFKEPITKGSHIDLVFNLRQKDIQPQVSPDRWVKIIVAHCIVYGSRL